MAKRKYSMKKILKVLGVLASLATIISCICIFYPRKDKTNVTSINSPANNTSNNNEGNGTISTVNNQNSGNNISKKENNYYNNSSNNQESHTIDAPNALIVTSNQQGGTNIVNTVDEPYVFDFFLADFSVMQNNFYYVAIPYSLHRKKHPVVQVLENTNGSFQQVGIEISSDSIGNVKIMTPMRFEGRAIVK